MKKIDSSFFTIKTPDWLSQNIKNVIENYLEILNLQKTSPMREYFDLYSYLVRILNKTKKVFIDPKMQHIWGKLESLSKEGAIKFASYLLASIENRYDGAMKILYKHRAEIESCQKIIKISKNLLTELEDHQTLFYGHMLQDNHDDVLKMLKKFIKNTSSDLTKFKNYTKGGKYLFSEIYPLSRQKEDKNSLAIFYMRSIYQFFLELFHQPMYGIIADIVNIIFDTSYTENHAVKYCAKIRSLRHDKKQKK